MKILTYSGFLDLEDPKPSQIHAMDIAIGLSRQFRFNGQSKKPCTVLDHSMNASNYRKVGTDFIESNRTFTSEYRRCMLLHDAAEAYIGDIIAPIKEKIPYFEEVENRLLEVIFKKFGANWELYRSDPDHLCRQMDLGTSASEIGWCMYNRDPEDLMELFDRDKTLWTYWHRIHDTLYNREWNVNNAQVFYPDAAERIDIFANSLRHISTST